MNPNIIEPLTMTNSHSIGQWIARFEQYCQARFRNKYAPLVRSLARFISPNSVIFDVGANHGRFTKHFAQIHNRSCKVFAFEPLDYNFTLAKAVLRSFPNVKIFPVALSSETGQADLFVPVKKSSKRIGTVYPHLGKIGCEQFFASASDRDVFRTTIRTETLDNIMALERLSKLDFMKVDVEGAESLVFRGGLNSITRYKPAIFCEIGSGFPERIGLTVQDSIRPLKELGYRMFTVDEKSGEPKLCHENFPRLTDYLFLHPGNQTTNHV